jgi:hypothetical protein
MFPIIPYERTLETTIEYNNPTILDSDPKRVTKNIWGNGLNAETPLFIEELK